MHSSSLLSNAIAAGLLIGSRCYAYNYNGQDFRHLTKREIAASNCSGTTFQVSTPPYENYFLSDCHSAAQLVATSNVSVGDALNDTNARIVVAWPAGNSGAVAYFGGATANETVGVDIVNSTVGSPLGPIYHPATPGKNALFGISTQVSFNVSANLTLATLGSIRTIRDGPGTVHPTLQTMDYITGSDGSITISRLWLDNVTHTNLSFTPVSSCSINIANDTNVTLTFDAGTYMLNATFDYPQLAQMSAPEVFAEGLYANISAEEPQEVNGIQFLSYTTKLLAGGWHYLIYFGRDSMISALLLQPALSQGKDSAMEAVLGAAIERLNYTSGQVCHEETIGDYATWTNLQEGITSTAPGCTYIMIDTDCYLSILMAEYFVGSATGAGRATEFLSTHPTFYPTEVNLTYSEKAMINAERVMSLAAPFTAPKGQIIKNLVHLLSDQLVGQWRDSTLGIGGARIPFDVNTALMPAALRAIGKLARAGIYSNSTWGTLADEYASVWENSTLQFFDISIPEKEAKQRVQEFVNSTSFPGPSQVNSIDGDVGFYALALNDSSEDTDHRPFQVETMHSDTSFRLLLVNDTNDAQLSRFLNNTAKSVMRTFPAGLLTDVGMFVANPAYGSGNLSYYYDTWTYAAYHGTVVWSFQLAMMARGFELQLSRCNDTTSATQPAFCQDGAVYSNVKTAYNKLWDAIEMNTPHLMSEIWSWTYSNNTFQFLDYSQTGPVNEGDGDQLWNLTFLAVTRNPAYT
ncbi:hypothetical protein F5Y16DRAFT_356850 [Xylariaceae sp. FL0255]|nr:hypothetical protein F5Y16DRAFT_356850 [Xylariaceae sp. FL0255]